MMRKELQKISESLEYIAQKENQAKFELYMKKPMSNSLEKIEEERVEYYKRVVGPFIKTHKDKTGEESQDLITMMRSLEKNYNSLICSSQTEIKRIAEMIFQNNMDYKFSINNRKATRAEAIHALETDDDASMRQRAWENFSSLGGLNRDMYVQLFLLRKETMRELKCPDLFQWNIEQRQLQDTNIPLFSIAKIAREKLASSLSDLYNIELSELHPWDLKYSCLHNRLEKDVRRKYQYGKFLNLLKLVVNESGYDFESLNINFYKTEIPYDGLCIGTYSQKVELLFNPRETFESLTYFFHEFGHAFHTIRQQNDNFLLAQAETDFFYEGVAYCFERIAANEQFMEQKLGLKERDILILLRQLKLRQLLDILSIIVRIEFEKRIYKCDINPDDIDEVYAEIYKELTGIEHPPTANWASSVYFAREIFSVLDYLLAEIIVEQTMASMYKKSDYKNYLSIIPMLDKYYILPGNGTYWNDKIKAFTGSYLSPQILMKCIK